MLIIYEIIAKACNFLLTWLQVFITVVAKPSLLFKLIPDSFYYYSF